ncbi:NAD(P)-dependent oxidoreductase [Leeia oryzae]|uniref:NAD(P)-dependent oxidoreductase n=1 Tax=Leeia oryzae TaxID=356662 RepID=UPI000362D8C4|nr:NAD(P)-dependent oxidoreductase [Leeia oryzae]
MTLIAGYAGLGIMGRPMAANLKAAGIPLAVFARKAASAQSLVDSGATYHATAASLAANCDVLFINVSDTPDVEAVLFGPGGVVEGARPGLVVVDMGTTSPSATRQFAERLAQQKIDMLDAPVSGGEIGAIQGTLTIMVGGKPAVFEKVKPLFEAMGKTITYVGDHGAGQVAKACNQIVVGGTIVAVAEALLFAEQQGVDGAKVREALLGGFAQSRILDVHGQRMLDDNFKPGFKAKLHQKDMRIVLEEALASNLALPGAAQVLQYLNALVGSGEGELDSAAMFHILKKMSH